MRRRTPSCLLAARTCISTARRSGLPCLAPLFRGGFGEAAWNNLATLPFRCTAALANRGTPRPAGGAPLVNGSLKILVRGCFDVHRGGDAEEKDGKEEREGDLDHLVFKGVVSVEKCDVRLKSKTCRVG